jgi:hypothetical protein
MDTFACFFLVVKFLPLPVFQKKKQAVLVFQTPLTHIICTSKTSFLCMLKAHGEVGCGVFRELDGTTTLVG